MKKRANDDSTSPGANEGWAVMTTLLAGFLVWGGIGRLLDMWWGTKFLTPVGLIFGMALGIYAVVARFGPMAGPSGSAVTATSSDQFDPGAPPPAQQASSSTRRPPAITRRETQ